MPTYEYQCNTCGKTFDVFQSMSSDAFTSCPEDVCEHSPKAMGEVVRKIGAGAGIIFNGSGFYLTDYKNRSGGEGSSSTSGTASKSASKDSASAHSAPSSAPAPTSSAQTTGGSQTSSTGD